MRFTKIVATIGPSTNSPEHLEHLMKMDVNVFRLNFSHGDHAYHGKSIKILHALRKKLQTPAAIMLDTKGPEIRSGVVEKPIRIRRGQQVLFTHKKNVKTKQTVIEVNYDGFTKDARKAKMILVDNGVLEFHIDSITNNGVLATTKDEGSIGSRRHINLPGAEVSLPSFTKKDWDDIGFGVKEHVDFIAPSFVRSGKDIKELRKFLEKKKSGAKIIAKIETAQAVENCEEIIDLSDGIMVARGDLGSEIPFEKVPAIQDKLVQECRRRGKAVIVATQMLESMTENPMPTRAEVTDVAHAASTFADATMLSGETAAGEYPFKAVTAMHRILSRTESSPTLHHLLFDIEYGKNEDISRIQQALAACTMAKNLDAKAILVITKTGRTARAVTRFRPHIPILAFTDQEQIFHQLSLTWGVVPYLIRFSADFEKTVTVALAILKKEKTMQPGSSMVIVSDIISRGTKKKPEHVTTVQIRKL